ncbi:MAG TPA: ATP-binding protein [Acholeplasmataceae bacterium]|nr:ATP-binding protein [Acholeplasmataceae bacterium]
MKRITFVAGHYGSGKSEFSLNLAINKKVNVLVDLDIVNPYFRSREVEEKLKEFEIKLISSSLKNALGSDLPFLSSDIYLPFYNKEITAIYDLGGNDTGAKIFRQFSDLYILEEVDLLLVINVYREDTASKDLIIKMIQSIESSTGIKVSGLINNSNYLRETKVKDILKGEKIILEVAKSLNLQVVYTAVYEELVNNELKLQGEIIPMKLYLRKMWL